MAKRIRMRDIKPYSLPPTLSVLSGPRSGRVPIRHAVRWVGNGTLNVDDRGDLITAYQAVLAEGQVSDQMKIINPALLCELWPTLHLDPRVRQLWEDRFPELNRANA